MQAVRFHQHGESDVLVQEEVDTPAPGAGEVLVRVGGVAFNPADAGIRAGTLPIEVSLPHVPGYDVSGTVERVGEGVTSLRIGDAVIGFLSMTADGGAAEYVVAPASALVSAPARIPLAEAAALPSTGLTAWQALFEIGGLTAGQRVLVVGAGGTVGGYAVQLAHGAGASVSATASERSRAAVEAAGADTVIDHGVPAILAAMSEPVDVLLNVAPLEQAEFDALAPLVRDGGVIVSTTPWLTTPTDEARGVRGATVYVHEDAGQLAELVRLVDAGELTVDVARRLPLSAIAGVHAEAATGSLRGKIVFEPALG